MGEELEKEEETDWNGKWWMQWDYLGMEYDGIGMGEKGRQLPDSQRDNVWYVLSNLAVICHSKVVQLSQTANAIYSAFIRTIGDTVTVSWIANI